MAIKKVSAEQAKKLKGTTDWQEVDNITDKDIEDAVNVDPDSTLPSDEDLEDFKLIKKRAEDKEL